jgi:uncharacterized protein (DUF697 family)
MSEQTEEKKVNDQDAEILLSKEKAEELIRKHTYGTMALGLVPIPFVDFVGVAAIQLNMVRKIANTYEIPFSQEAFKNTIGALIGGAIPGLAGMPISSLMKTIPVVGQGLGALSMPVVAGASTYAIGKVFYRHFASGGSFLTFDVDKARDYYQEQFKKGETIVSEMMKKNKEGNSSTESEA